MTHLTQSNLPINEDEAIQIRQLIANEMERVCGDIEYMLLSSLKAKIDALIVDSANNINPQQNTSTRL